MVAIPNYFPMVKLDKLGESMPVNQKLKVLLKVVNMVKVLGNNVDSCFLDLLSMYFFDRNL